MSTAVDSRVLVASFTNDHLGICANVREIHESEEHEFLVVDAFSGDVVITRIFPNKEEAVAAAKVITQEPAKL
ncbi:MAG: hypothetical protein WA869_17625 [Alloacidobacterium sp.]|jgi:hypothetical protein